MTKIEILKIVSDLNIDFLHYLDENAPDDVEQCALDHAGSWLSFSSNGEDWYITFLDLCLTSSDQFEYYDDEIHDPKYKYYGMDWKQALKSDILQEMRNNANIMLFACSAMSGSKT